MNTSDLREHILMLFNTSLSDHSLQDAGEDAAPPQRLVLPGPAAGRGGLALVDQQRLQGALTMANTHVCLLIALMEMLLEEICSCRQDLNHSLHNPVNTELVVETVRMLHKHLKDFDTRDCRNLGPLNLDNHLIIGSGQQSVSRVNASLSFRPPVVFDQLKSHAKATSAHLFWKVIGEQPPEPHQMYELQVKIMHPFVGEQGLEQYAVQGLGFTKRNLIQKLLPVLHQTTGQLQPGVRCVGGHAEEERKRERERRQREKRRKRERRERDKEREEKKERKKEREREEREKKERVREEREREKRRKRE
ncbi:hypothetical protein WMY93_018393 [Mugilogobius chulae]|uniref:Uncharacterized protein n=1 Tax=Mugilogobius chulae TaxID=88201 RepID=A0AAW0NMZ8_9GOBI